MKQRLQNRLCEDVPPVGRVQEQTTVVRDEAAELTGEPRWLYPILLAPVAVFLYLNSFVWPNTPFLQTGDQMYFWVGAQRMIYGDHIYRDFLQFTPPGTDLLYLGFVKMFGLRIWLPNLVNVLLGVGLSAVCFRIACLLLKRGPAFLAVFLFLVVPYARPLNGTHHWFSLLAIVGSVATTMQDRNTERIALAGALLGAASFFTQTHGVFALLGLLAFILWEGHQAMDTWQTTLKKQSIAILGYVVVLASLSAYFIARLGWKRFWYFEVTYPGRYIAYGQHPVLFGLFPSWHNLPNIALFLLVYAMLPVSYALTIKRCWRVRRGMEVMDRRLMLLALTGLSLFIEVALSPNYLRVYAVAMPGVILFVWIVVQVEKVRPYLFGLLWANIATLAMWQVYSRQHKSVSIAELPAGRVAVSSQDYEKLSWLMQRTRPNQFFFQATVPMLYVPLYLRNPTFLNEATENESTRPEDVQRVIRELDEDDVRYVLWSPYNNHADLEYPSAYHLAPLRDYLRTRYERVYVFQDEDEIWQRK